jgi:hypothetical protein
MTLGAEIPAYPVPRVERHGLTTIELRRREAAKAKQARGFEVVSEGHGRYIVARALAPGLHPVFEEAPMRHVDGRARSEVTLDDPALAAFADAFVADFRTYFVRRLDDVAVRVSVLAASPGTGELVALPSDAWGVDLGDAALRPSFDGVRLCWHGTMPAGAHGLLLRPIMQAVGGNEPFDPRALAGLVWRALTFHAPAAMHATVVGVFSQNHARLALHRGEPGAGSLDAPPGALLASRTWSPLHDHPPTPFLSQPNDDAMARAHIFGPPRNLVDVPWPSERWPRRVARALTGAASRALLQGELVVREASTRWVHAQFQLHEGALDAYVLPPGPEGCAWQGNHLRLVIQDREGSRSASGVLLIRNLTSVLDALDRHG